MNVSMSSAPSLIFTEPWDPIVVRRGDALGLRAFADQIADAVAPGLSNRVRDGRWVTILAWCLVRSNELFHASGGSSIITSDELRQRYAWLRPLELMWVARTIAIAGDDWKKRSLPGQRRVKPWYESPQDLPRFGMSHDQYRGYRQSGPYGAYRVAFRKWPGLTRGGDGWTPDGPSLALAKWLDQKLGSIRPRWSTRPGDDDSAVSPRSAKHWAGREAEWWLRNWDSYDEAGRSAERLTLPRRSDEYEALPEADHIAALVFGKDRPGERRRSVALAVLRAGASHHLGICEYLGRAFATVEEIRLLPGLSRLADAGMEGMRLVAEVLGDGAQVPLSAVAGHPRAGVVCKEMNRAAKAWLERKNDRVRHSETADRFAEKVQPSSKMGCLRELVQHHETAGGGQRWFVLRNGKIEPRMPAQGQSSSYRFRLWPLCRLAVQCRVLPRMPSVLQDVAEVEDDGDGEDHHE